MSSSSCVAKEQLEDDLSKAQAELERLNMAHFVKKVEIESKITQLNSRKLVLIMAEPIETGEDRVLPDLY